MKRRATESLFSRACALCIFALACAACGGANETAQPAATPPPVSTVTVTAPARNTPDPAEFGGGAPAANTTSATTASTANANSVNTLPPPKPVTLPLASRTGDPVDEQIVSGDQLFEQGDLAGAAHQYEAAKRSAPKRAAPIVGLARVTIARSPAPMDYAAAKGDKTILAASKELKRATQIDATFGPAYVELGRALLLLGDAPGAIDSLRKGVQLLPSEAEAHSTLGIALLATGHGDESLTELARAAELDAGSAARHGNLGTVLFMRGKVPEAIREYEIEVHLVDGDARAHSDLGTALLAHNEIPRAITELERAIAIDPKRATFRSNLGYALQIQGKRPEAIAQYREALKLDSKLASAWINLATVLAHDPSTRAEARAALEKARAIDPTDPRVKANLEELDALEKGTSPPP